MRPVARVVMSLALMPVAAPAAAEIVAADAHGLSIRVEAQLVQSPAQAYAAFGDIGRWWDRAHSYSGDAANLTLSLVPGGCFCERLPGGGGVEHLRVALVRPGEEIVLTGALGPLLYEATSGVMQARFLKVAGGTKLVLTYRATGFVAGDAARLAALVNMVLVQQVARYRAHVATRRNGTGDPLDKR